MTIGICGSEIRDKGGEFENWDLGYLEGWNKIGVGIRPITKLISFLESAELENCQFDFNKSYGDAPHDMSVLSDTPNVRAIQCDAWYQDSTIINSFSGLLSFRDHVYNRESIDWEKLYSLQDLGIYDYNASRHPDYAKFSGLVSLSTTQLPKKYASFSFLGGKHIELLSVRKSQLRTFEGLTDRPNLRELQLVGCRKLEPKGLDSELQNLKRLSLSGCSNIKDLDFIQCLPKLENLDLDSLGEITDFEVLRGHKNLKSITGSIRKGPRIPKPVVDTIPTLEFISPALLLDC